MQVTGLDFVKVQQCGRQDVDSGDGHKLRKGSFIAELTQKVHKESEALQGK